VSRVYFHSEHGTAELRGSERAHLGQIVDRMTTGFLSSMYGDDVDRLLGLIRPGHYLHKEDRGTGWLGPWVQSFTTALNVGFRDGLLSWRGKPIDPFALRLNTALKYGNDTVRLAARLHGQCEIHCFVEGVSRAWLAGLITDGLDAGIFREGQWFVDGPSRGPAIWHPQRKWSDEGWRDVVKLLLDRDDEPVVCSYSVCDQFPNAEAAGWMPPPMPEGWAPNWATGEDGRAEWERDYPGVEERRSYYEDEAAGLWYDLPADEQWRRALAGVRGNPGGLEISPAEFGKFYFAHGLDVTDLLAPDYADRLDKALGFNDGAAAVPVEAPVPGAA
jgi:hypothetical protein